MLQEAPDSRHALELAGLDWKVVQKEVQNEDAFAFTDELLGRGITFETAGSLQGGRRTWMLAKLPERYIISGDEITPYLVYRFVNAVSDFATHAKPIRERSNYRESLFGRTVDGNAIIDRAYAMVKAA